MAAYQTGPARGPAVAVVAPFSIEGGIIRLKALCNNCKHRESCKAPCGPLEHILRKEGPSRLYEWKAQNGKDIVLKNPAEKYFWVWDEGTREELTQEFEDVPENRLGALLDFTPNNTRTKVFAKRAFENKTFKQIADELGLSVRNATYHFSKAKKRAVKILKDLDDQGACIKFAKQAKNLDDSTRWFFLHKVCGLTYSQVKELCPDVPGRKPFSGQMRRRVRWYEDEAKRDVSGAA